MTTDNDYDNPSLLVETDEVEISSAAVSSQKLGGVHADTMTQTSLPVFLKRCGNRLLNR